MKNNLGQEQPELIQSLIYVHQNNQNLFQQEIARKEKFDKMNYKKLSKALKSSI